MTLSEDDKIETCTTVVAGKITDFSIHFMSKIDGKWENILRVDTESHGDSSKRGVAHVHHFYKKTKEFYQSLGDKDLDMIYESWLKNIKTRAKHIKEAYRTNK